MRHHIRHSKDPATRPGRCRARLLAAFAERITYLRHHPDEGAETAEVVIGIALAAGAAILIWKFLGPALLDIVKNALGSL